jgi:hypothetical protein
MAKQKPETPIFLSCYKRVQERSGARTSEHDRVATRKAAWILRAWSLRIQLHSAWQHALCRQHRHRFFRSRPPKKEKPIAASSRKRPPIRKHLKLAPNSCTIETLKRGWGGAERRGEGELLYEPRGAGEGDRGSQRCRSGETDRGERARSKPKCRSSHVPGECR